MPSANYVTRDTAPGLNKRGSVCRDGPREVHRGGEGLRPGLGVGLVCSAKAAGGGHTRAPRRQGPGPSAGPLAAESGPPGLGPSPIAAAASPASEL